MGAQRHGQGRGARRRREGVAPLLVAVAVVAGASALPAAAVADAGRWAAVGSLATARYDHTATLLEGGDVLVAGGSAPGPRGVLPTGSAERFDPVTGAWQATGSLAIPRANHSATAFDGPSCGSHCGDVMVAGGLVGVTLSNATATVELYDADSGTWQLGIPMIVPRYDHTATVLADGRLLVAGGRGAFFTPSAEIYDPVDRSWSLTGSLTDAYYDHTATLLADGRVLVVGAASAGSTAEVFDPTATDPATGRQGRWTPTAAPAVQRFDHTATLLDDGTVLVAGTAGGTEASGDGSSAEVYDPVTATWNPTGSLSARYARHSATRLAGGEVLVAGGAGSTQSELYDASSGSWRLAGALTGQRENHTATLLDSGAVLAAGGRSGGAPINSAEVYEPAVVPRPVVSIGDVTVAEGNAGSRTAVFSVSLSEPTSAPVTVAYATADGTATADADYRPTAGTVSFAPGATSASVEVTVMGDTLVEGHEDFFVVLSDATGAEIGDGTGRGLIVDDDHRGRGWRR